MFLPASRIPHVAISFLLLTSKIHAASNSAVLPLKASSYQTWYTAEVQFGNQTLSVVTDSGSSDLWVITENFKCYFGSASTFSGTQVPESECVYNSTYQQSSTFTPDKSAYILEHYGQGDAVGPAGYEDVQIGSIAISQQEMAFIDSTNNGVDTTVSGVMGLAYPALGQFHPSSYHPTNITASNAEELILKDRIAYPTVLKRLQSMGITFYSFALERLPVSQEMGFGGYLAFGTLPPVDHGDFVTVPVEILKPLPLIFTNGTQTFAYWTITVDAVTWENTNNSQPFQAVVDSGNGINYLPQDIAAKFNAAFDPPGKFNTTTGDWDVHCNATPPYDFAIQIGGQSFSINSADLIMQNSAGDCYSAISAPALFVGTKIPILGDTFLKNVVAVFDYGQHEMKFAPRQTNSSSSGPAPSSGATALALGSRHFVLVFAAVLLIFSVI